MEEAVYGLSPVLYLGGSAARDNKCKKCLAIPSPFLSTLQVQEAGM